MATHPEPTQEIKLPAEGYIRMPALRRIIPLSRSTIWRKAKDGTFPKPVRISEGISAWKVEDIRDWMKQHEAA